MGSFWRIEILPRGGLRRLLWGIASLTLAATWAYLRHDPERSPELSALQYLPWPLLALPMGALWLAMWPLGWRWALVGVMPIAMVLGPISGFTVGWGEQGRVPVRVMSYNVKSVLLNRQPMGPAELAHEVNWFNPDVVVTQAAEQLLAHELLHPEDFKRLAGGRAIRNVGQYVIFSRYPFVRCDDKLTAPSGLGFNYFHCVLDVQGRHLNLINLHFMTPRSGLNALRQLGVKGVPLWRMNLEVRLAESAAVAEAVRNCPRPCVVAGDFNAPEHSRVVQQIAEAGFRDAWRSASWGWGYTHGHSLIRGWSFSRIDHILVSEDVAVARTLVGGAIASEHRPVVSDLYLQRH